MERDAEEVAGVAKAAGDGKVGTRRGRIAGRVGVRDDDAGGVVTDGGFEDLARMDQAFVERADRDGLAPDFLTPTVEEEHDEVLPLAPADIFQPIPHVFRGKDHGCLLVPKEALPDFETRDDFAGLGSTEPLDRFQFDNRRLADSLFPERRKDLFRKCHDIGPLQSGPQENRQKLLIFEFLRPVLLHSFAGPFDFRDIFHPCHINKIYLLFSIFSHLDRKNANLPTRQAKDPICKAFF